MEFDKRNFVKRLDGMLGLIKNLEAAFEEELEKLSTKDIKELTDILEKQLVDTLDYLKATK